MQDDNIGMEWELIEVEDSKSSPAQRRSLHIAVSLYTKHPEALRHLSKSDADILIKVFTKMYQSWTNSKLAKEEEHLGLSDKSHCKFISKAQ